ncbi:nucleoside deaminase [Desulforhopalus vacuolatus]|uniref:nucleoside deaminase n=1 Tax=Desulforhopalus vacuolatus TaxID=40414 RepID=UPI0019625263|nr:nucleoside deaminase [Desulforhopalus vacuolatus]MBM9520047.1 nucleoside deaminase [Desulforhopalus vacuolatus]
MMTGKIKQLTISLFVLIAIMVSGCATKDLTRQAATTNQNIVVDEKLLNEANAYAEKQVAMVQIDAAAERDNIFMLLAYAVVYKNWQNSDMANNRGYNIGSVLVDENNEVVYWARNSVNVTKNMTQHGEVRLMDCYLATHGPNDLKGYTIYTTLEPCAMCSGMMFLTSMPRTVYGQKDPSFGDAIERLEFDSTSLPGGYPPYPRHVISNGSHLSGRYVLDYYYKVYVSQHQDAHITVFLTTAEAALVFSSALNTLEKYQVKYPENQEVKEKAIAFYNTKVTSSYTKLCPEQ